MTRKPKICATHRSQYQRGCPECRHYYRTIHRTRHRLKAYGRWQHKVDAAPARLRLQQLRANGMSTRQIAKVTGVSRYAIRAVNRGQPQAAHYIVEAILGCPVKASERFVDATGTARRLHALARAGYSNADIGQYLDRHTITVARWRIVQPGDAVSVATHQMIAALYERLWGTEGPSPAAKRYAERTCLLPFEAWTDATIDDPQALPYSDREANEYIDEVLLQAVIRRERKFLELSDMERLRLYRQHVAGGGTPRSFRDRYRPVPAAVLRWLQAQVEQETIAA